MRLLIVTDAFPPRCGGSGWSTFHLARGLASRGHEVHVVRPEPRRSGVRRSEIDGIAVADFGYPFRDVPYLRSWLREERLPPRLERFLLDELADFPADVIHAQHVLSTPPAVAAAIVRNLPSVVTVRDYWPTCYFTTAEVEGATCPECSFGKMLDCMREKSPRAYWAGVPLMPYMRRAVRRRQRFLAAADAVIAVSDAVAERAVRPVVGAARSHVIPNSIDAAEVARVSAAAPRVKLPQRFVAFAGKLVRSKGAWLALEVAARLAGRIPLVLVGDGEDRSALEGAVRARGLAVCFLPWVDNHEVWRILRRATAVLAPSLWDEPLSRTVTEAMAVGTPVVATDRGGIHDQLRHHESGAIVPPDPSALAGEIDRLLVDPSLARSWAERARQTVASRFDHAAVIPRIEALYAGLVESRRSRHAFGTAAEAP